MRPFSVNDVSKYVVLEPESFVTLMQKYLNRMRRKKNTNAIILVSLRHRFNVIALKQSFCVVFLESFLLPKTVS